MILADEIGGTLIPSENFPTGAASACSMSATGTASLGRVSARHPDSNHSQFTAGAAVGRCQSVARLRCHQPLCASAGKLSRSLKAVHLLMTEGGRTTANVSLTTHPQTPDLQNAELGSASMPIL